MRIFYGFGRRLSLRGLALLGALVIGACTETSTGAQTGQSKYTQAFLDIFDTGCLNEERSMRAALNAFEAHGFSYIDPSNSHQSSRHYSKLGSVRVPANVGFANRHEGKSWDTRLLGCSMYAPGLFAAELFPEIHTSLLRNGFTATTKITPTFSKDGVWRADGLYSRDGVRYEVLLVQAAAASPKVKSSGNVYYVRGNSRTLLSINSLSEPKGFRLPES